MIDRGINIHFFKGNHDMWTIDYFENIGLKVYDNIQKFKIDDSNIIVGHGDGLGEGDTGYKVIKSIFKNKKLLIAGGGDSALDWTNELSKGSNVTLIHRRKEFRAAPDSVSKMQELETKGKIKFLKGQIKKISKIQNSKLMLEYENDDERSNIEVDYLLPFFGLKMELGPIAEWGLNLHENLIKVDTEKFETSTPSIFAIGDINWYPGKLKLILSGFHESALMAQEVFKYCFPDKKNIFRYTTSSKELQKKLGV